MAGAVALSRDPEPSMGLAEGLTWSHRIPILNNRYVWVRWGWAALAFGLGFSIVLGTPLVVVFAGANGGVAFALKVYVAIVLIAGLAVVGLGLFAAVVVANGVTSRFSLSPQRALPTTSQTLSESAQN